MLSSVCRRQPHLTLPFLLPRGVHARNYTQQRTARTAQSAPQKTTTNPSPAVQRKNRTLPTATATAGPSAKVVIGAPAPAAPTVDNKEFARVRHAEATREMERSGKQLDLLRMSMARGMDPWAHKSVVMDLRIPSKSRGLRGIRDNFKNNLQNVLSMFRLASDFAFPGIVSKWRFNPQVFRAQSTSEKAWVAPYRHDLLDIYTRINQAIASGDKKTLTKLTAYEYQAHAFNLLTSNIARMNRTGNTTSWSLSSLISPVKILSLRAFPAYSAPEEPRYGNRNCVQALVRFETLQSLTVRDARGRVLRPDGSVAEEGYIPEKRRVLEYFICENKMFYQDGWYIREQVYEGVTPRFKYAVSMD